MHADDPLIYRASGDFSVSCAFFDEKGLFINRFLSILTLARRLSADF
jgi:hypothetical protein